MASDKVAKRQKVSHGSDGPTSPAKTKSAATPTPTTTKDASPPPVSSDSDSPDNEHAEDIVEEVEEVAPKTFKDLV